MAFVKWIAIFLVSFAVAFVIIVTFSQPEFQVRVSAHLFAYQTRALPVWAYVAGAMGLGLLAGAAVSIYYNVVLRAAIFKKDRRIKALETELHATQAIPEKFVTPQEPAGDDSF
jgi:uncharacterized membrane protein YciS (DUF1049 family)